MSSDTSLITFKAICNFTDALNELFGKRQRSLALYDRLIKKTTIAHETAIEKHINAFKTFCTDNRESILLKDFTKLNNKTISYSEKVFINMELIFKWSDADIKQTIWSHILTISALVDPSNRAKQVLKETLEKTSSNPGETEFLTNIIEKVEQNVNPDASPMEAVGAIMNSGVFNELLSGMQSGIANGELDLTKLMGAVQGIVGNLSQQAGDNPDSQQAMNMVNNMLSGMSNLQMPQEQPSINEVE